MQAIDFEERQTLRIFKAVIKIMTMKILFRLLLPCLLLAGCVTQDSRQLSGTLVGMQLGSVVGRAVGFAADDYGGSLAGAAIGAVAGAAVGNIINAPKSSEAAPQSAPGSTAAEAPKSKQQRGREQIEQAIAEASAAGAAVSVDNVLFEGTGGSDILRRGETAKLSFDIINTSDETIALVEPLVECSNKNIEISSMVAIENIAPDEGVRYTVSLTASRLRSGTATIIIKLSVDNGAYKVMRIHKISTEK